MLTWFQIRVIFLFEKFSLKPFSALCCLGSPTFCLIMPRFFVPLSPLSHSAIRFKSQSFAGGPKMLGTIRLLCDIRQRGIWQEAFVQTFKLDNVPPLVGPDLVLLPLASVRTFFKAAPFCLGAVSVTKKRCIYPASVNCDGSWTDDATVCSVSCGDGTKSQTFHIQMPAAYGGTDCVAADLATQSVPCNVGACGMSVCLCPEIYQR